MNNAKFYDYVHICYVIKLMREKTTSFQFFKFLFLGLFDFLYTARNRMSQKKKQQKITKKKKNVLKL